MNNKELIDYIRKTQKLGFQAEEINEQLYKAGWNETAISEAWTKLSTSPFAFLKFWYKKLLILVIVILVLGGGGYFAYAQYSSNPQRIWQIVSQNSENLKSGHFRVEGSYSEQAQKLAANDEALSQLFGGLGEINISMSAEGDFQMIQTNEANFGVKSSAGVKLGGFGINIDGESRKVGKNFFYKISDNPLYALFNGASSQNKKAEWIKIDFTKTKNEKYAKSLPNLTDEQINLLQESLLKAHLLKVGRVLGTEKLDNKTTLHYAATLEKTDLRNFVATLAKVIGKEMQVSDLDALLNKLEFRKIEVWVGKSEKQIYQVVFESNFPSLFSGLVKTSLEEARGKSRDAKRIADIRQLQIGLELFYNDNHRYPTATSGMPILSDGKPALSTYLAILATAPTPPDGSCQANENLYWYQQQNQGASYTLRACLGNETGGVLPGIIEATPAGIQTIETKTVEEKNKNPLADLPMGGTLKLKLNLSNFNKELKIEEPAGAMDYFEATNSMHETPTGTPSQ